MQAIEVTVEDFYRIVSMQAKLVNFVEHMHRHQKKLEDIMDGLIKMSRNHLEGEEKILGLIKEILDEFKKSAE
jgi:hemerythrin